jgi:hypothetical protein
VLFAVVRQVGRDPPVAVLARRPLSSTLALVSLGDRKRGKPITLSGAGARVLAVDSDRPDVAERTLAIGRKRARRACRLYTRNQSTATRSVACKVPTNSTVS